MKKSLITLALASIFMLSACDDKTSQKLLESEKKVVQLEAEYKKVQAELATKTTELAQAQTKLDYSKSSFPALQVEIVKLVEKSDSLKFEKDPKDEYAREQSDISLFISIPKTQVEWLDTLLLKSLWLHYVEADKQAEAEKQSVTEEQVKSFFEQQYQQTLATVKEDKYPAYTESGETYYLGQRNHIVSFSQNFYHYSGGAHGIGQTNYLNVDINKQAIITLDDLVSQKNQAKLREILWESYKNERLDENGKFEESFMTHTDFFIANNFYFTPNGVTFVYPVYALGPYVEGEIEIFAGFEQLKDLISPDYFPTQKDGYGLNDYEYNY